MKKRKIICAIITPFRKNRVDYEGFVSLLKFLKEKRTDGVLVCGTTGEFPLLSLSERKRLIKLALEEETSKFQVIPHVGDVRVKDARRLGTFAKELGASLLAAVTPYYYRWGFREVVQYFRSLSELGTKLMVYEIPEYANVKLSLSELKKLIVESNATALKESTTEPKRLREILPLKEHVSLFVGSDAMIKKGLELGFDGCVSALANFVPELVRRLVESTGIDGRKAERLQSQLNEIRSLCKKEGGIRAIKAALQLRGFPAWEVREPFVNFAPEERNRFLEEMKRSLGRVGC